MIYLQKALSVIFLASCFQAAQADGHSDLKRRLFKLASANHQALSYRSARQHLFNQIYLETNDAGAFVEGVYCQDKFYRSSRNPRSIPDHTRFNTEHSWPQSKFNRRFPSHFQKSDLHHLFPTFSRINSQRSNYGFAEVNNRRDLFCQGPAIGDPARGGGGTYFEPPDKHKGNTARAMFYFSIRYKISIDSVQERYLRMWHRQDPVDKQEKLRHEKIVKTQGNRNPFIDRPELVDQIKNF